MRKWVGEFHTTQTTRHTLDDSTRPQVQDIKEQQNTAQIVAFYKKQT